MSLSKLFISLLTCVVLLNAQQITLQPYPKNIEVTGETVNLLVNGKVNIQASEDEEVKAANYLAHLLKEKFDLVTAISHKNIDDSFWKVVIVLQKEENEFPNSQYYKIAFDEQNKEIKISSPGQLGLIYGVVTFSEFLTSDNDKLVVTVLAVDDYPTFERRMFVANPTADEIHSLFDFALKNKFETVVLASRQHQWYEVSDEYLSILKEIKKWKEQFGAPKVMQSHNIYEERGIVISNKDDIDALKNVIAISYKHGIEKLMILADDTPPFKFGEGYILTDENDKKMFRHFEEANTYLMNELASWFERENYEIESYYVPAFYTYEDMHQGDMELFMDTPWEEDAFNPLYRDLSYIGKNIDKNVFVVWTGPFVRSRKISKSEVDDWTKNLSGRVPFLWDNTIYSHHQFTATPLLTAYDNDFPENFNELTAGNGIFINGDINSEETVIAAITTNDYMWNPLSYEPDKSLDTAIAREYGSELVEPIKRFKESELNFRKLIGQRKLWFQSDSLWQQIRKVRFVTQKNPFYFHLNYTRMKALRLQLRASIPEPESKNEFIEKCNALYKERETLLQNINVVNPEVYKRLKNTAEQLPDFEKIQ